MKNLMSLYLAYPESPYGDTDNRKSDMINGRVTAAFRRKFPKSYVRYLERIRKVRTKNLSLDEYLYRPPPRSQPAMLPPEAYASYPHSQATPFPPEAYASYTLAPLAQSLPYTYQLYGQKPSGNLQMSMNWTGPPLPKEPPPSQVPPPPPPPLPPTPTRPPPPPPPPKI